MLIRIQYMCNIGFTFHLYVAYYIDNEKIYVLRSIEIFVVLYKKKKKKAFLHKFKYLKILKRFLRMYNSI